MNWNAFWVDYTAFRTLPQPDDENHQLEAANSVDRTPPALETEILYSASAADLSKDPHDGCLSEADSNHQEISCLNRSLAIAP